MSKPVVSFKLFCGGDGDRSVVPVKTTPELPSILLTSEGKGTENEKKLFTIFNIVILDNSIGICEYD
jgi:hypothetical protein